MALLRHYYPSLDPMGLTLGQWSQYIAKIGDIEAIKNGDGNTVMMKSSARLNYQRSKSCLS